MSIDLRLDGVRYVVGPDDLWLLLATPMRDALARLFVWMATGGR